MERTERVTLTNLCMIRDGTRVLVQEKNAGETRGIIFPGGHVEEHEPIVDAVKREVLEETGLTVEAPRLCGVKDWVEEDGSRYLVFLFTADRFTGTLTSSEEGRVFWMERDQVLSSNWIWHMDGLMRIMDGGEFAELWLDAADGWRPVLK